MQSWNPAAGPVIVTFWMFIVCPAAALVTIAPLNSGMACEVVMLFRSVAEMVWPRAIDGRDAGGNRQGRRHFPAVGGQRERGSVGRARTDGCDISPRQWARRPRRAPTPRVRPRPSTTPRAVLRPRRTQGPLAVCVAKPRGERPACVTTADSGESWPLRTPTQHASCAGQCRRLHAIDRTAPNRGRSSVALPTARGRASAGSAPSIRCRRCGSSRRAQPGCSRPPAGPRR